MRIWIAAIVLAALIVVALSAQPVEAPAVDRRWLP